MWVRWISPGETEDKHRPGEILIPKRRRLHAGGAKRKKKWRKADGKKIKKKKAGRPSLAGGLKLKTDYKAAHKNCMGESKFSAKKTWGKTG